MAECGEDIEMAPLKGQIDETVEDKEPSNIAEFQETSIQSAPSEVIGQENMWIETRFREYNNQID